MLNRMNNILLNIQINEEKVINNIDKTKGVIFAQELLNSLITKGLTRNIAYDKVQFYAHKALAENISFYELIKTDEEINKLFKPEELIQIFDIKKHLKNVDKIFKRIEQK
jgi:adenylosuccinate lyase